MAAELLGGADVGAVFGELLEAVLNEIKQSRVQDETEANRKNYTIQQSNFTRRGKVE
ncbi:hypothetical protein NC652_023534 [Populus alba x Populus x berolinensis]|nr:hypothetical protein NC652_023534 [Populus alba x Populus x berolinensis]